MSYESSRSLSLLIGTKGKTTENKIVHFNCTCINPNMNSASFALESILHRHSRGIFHQLLRFREMTNKVQGENMISLRSLLFQLMALIENRHEKKKIMLKATCLLLPKYTQ